MKDFTRIHFRRNVLKTALLGSSIGLTGCMMVGPDYDPATPPLPDAWTQSLHQELSTDDMTTPLWWQLFKDPTLNRLIQKTAEGNLDLKTAVARIEEARLQTAISKGERLPEVTATGAAFETRSSEETTPALPPGLDREETLFSLGATVAWELDFWGRIRRSVESKQAAYEGVIEDYRDVRILLFANVASTYVDVRSLQSRLALAHANVKLQLETLDITKHRNSAGLVPDLDVYQAELNLSSTRASIPALRAQLGQAMNQLSTLSGQGPGALNDLLAQPGKIPSTPEKVSTGLPVDLLRKRPDIRSAERALASQHARIGLTQAALYPTFSLPGTFSLEAPDSGNVLNGDALRYSFGPSLRWNLFSAGRIRNAMRVEESRTEQAVLQYEKTVLVALQEVENAMISIVEERNRNVALLAAAEAASKSVSMVDKLYRSGLTDFQNVLDMQRSLSAQEDALASSQGQLAKNCILLFKALGGGWQTDESVAPTPLK